MSFSSCPFEALIFIYTIKAMPKEREMVKAKYLIAPVANIAKDPKRRVIEVSINTTCFLERFNLINW